MPLPTLVDQNGRPIPLDRMLGNPGGEGAVYAVGNDPAQAVKVYHEEHATPVRAEKVAAMVGLANPRLLALTAWPTGLVYHARPRKFAGFLMPRAVDAQPLQHLYNPVMRVKCFPRAGWKFQVRAATNLAAAFDEIHTAGHVMGDVNERNELVSSQALVTLIDCDSFEVRANGKPHLCEVGTPLFIPPELQGKPLRGLTRTENHDRFGLAVLIYQLLFVGRHPYAGIYRGAGDPSFGQLIAEFRFAQGPMAHTWGMSPPPHIPTFADIPAEVGNLFRRAFERGSETGTRPRPADWVAALKRLEGEIATCTTDPGHTYWKGAGACVWCRIERTGGPENYFGVAVDAATFAVDEARLRDVLRRLKAAQLLDFPYVREQYLPPHRFVGRELPANVARLRAAWESLRGSHETRMQAREAVEGQELRAITGREAAEIDRLGADFYAADAELHEEYEALRRATASERSHRRNESLVLGAVVATSFGVMLLGCLHRAFAVVGAVLVALFGMCLAVHTAVNLLNPQRQRLARLSRERRDAAWRFGRQVEAIRVEFERAREAVRAETREVEHRYGGTLRAAEAAYRREVADEEAMRVQAHRDAAQQLDQAVRAWADRVTDYQREHRNTTASIPEAVTQCRGLAELHEQELKRLSGTAEATARERHLRLNTIADADIPDIGRGLKQTLADNNVFSAADVDEQVIRAISGFGPSRTQRLLAWRARVLQEFRFDPATGVHPAEHRALAMRFQTRQQQLLQQIDGQLAKLESLAPACRAALEGIAPRIRDAVARVELARANLEVLGRG